MSTHSSARRSAWSMRLTAVRPSWSNAAASAIPRPTGTAIRSSTATTARSRYPPRSAVLATTRRPTQSGSTPSPTEATSPATPAPGTYCRVVANPSRAAPPAPPPARTPPPPSRRPPPGAPSPGHVGKGRREPVTSRTAADLGVEKQHRSNQDVHHHLPGTGRWLGGFAHRQHLGSAEFRHLHDSHVSTSWSASLSVVYANLCVHSKN